MGTHPIFESDFDCLTDYKNCRFLKMSDSEDSDNEFKELFDVFDQVEEENLQSSSICDQNLELHGKRIDPYAEKISIQEKDKNIINSLKRKADGQNSSSPAPKSLKIGNGTGMMRRCNLSMSKDEDETA